MTDYLQLIGATHNLLLATIALLLLFLSIFVVERFSRGFDREMENLL